MTDKTRKSKPGFEGSYWCCAAEFDEHEADCPNASSVVEALPTEDSTAELTRKKIWGWWHQSKQDFGRAHMQSFVRDAIQEAIDAEKAELSRQLQWLSVNFCDKHREINLCSSGPCGMCERDELATLNQLYNESLAKAQLRYIAAEAKLAEDTRELEQLKLEKALADEAWYPFKYF